MIFAWLNLGTDVAYLRFRLHTDESNSVIFTEVYTQFESLKNIRYKEYCFSLFIFSSKMDKYGQSCIFFLSRKIQKITHEPTNHQKNTNAKASFQEPCLYLIYYTTSTNKILSDKQNFFNIRVHTNRQPNKMTCELPLNRSPSCFEGENFIKYNFPKVWIDGDSSVLCGVASWSTNSAIAGFFKSCGFSIAFQIRT